MPEYEFNEAQRKTIKNVAWRCIVQSILLVLIGVAGIIGAFIKVGLTPTMIAVLIIQNILFFGTGFSFFPPSLNFLKVASTEGSDIEQMISGLRKLKLGFMLIIFFVLGSITCDIILIILS